MIDRTLNLIFLFCILLIIITVICGVNDALQRSEVWEQEWIERTIGCKNTSDQFDDHKHYELDELIIAIKNLRLANDYSAAQQLENYLRKNYKAIGVTTIISKRELNEILFYTAIVSLFLLFPICANYIRHGRFRVWNRTPN